MSHALLTVSQLRALEAKAGRDLPAGELMQRAGKAAARWIDRKLQSKRTSICVVAGPGNNGGDGFVTAHALRALGHMVQIFLPGNEPSGADAAIAVRDWKSGGGNIASAMQLSQFDVVVDAMFGIGSRALSGPYLDAARLINASGMRIYALDLPSGLDTDRGCWIGGVAGVRAHATLTFLADKPGLRTGDGCEAAGAIEVDTLGVETPTSSTALTAPQDFAAICKPRSLNTHKGSFGSLDVIGGGKGMVGAALLAARAGLRLGAGRVYVHALGSAELTVDLLAPELMFRSSASTPDVAASVIGCGLGDAPEALAALPATLAVAHALVIDADALNLIAADASLQAAVAARTSTTVLTPHPLEAARLLGIGAADIQRDRIESARQLSRRYESIVVLKGAGTVIATPSGQIWINSTGGPALASAGTGDVLAGMIGALLAQGFDAIECTIGAVWLHGRAADDYGADIGLSAGEIAPRAVAALAALRKR